MKIAYFSPLNPEKSGISDYSEELLPLLGKYLTIDIYVKNPKSVSNKVLKDMFQIYSNKEFEMKKHEYNTYIYHMGNNCSIHNEIYETLLKYPGIVVIHDYALHHFFAEYYLNNNRVNNYIEEMIYNYGLNGFQLANEFLEGKIQPLWENYSLQYPLIKRITDHARGIITTSSFVYNKIKKDTLPICNIPVHAPEILDLEMQESINKETRKKLGIEEDILVLGTFGFLSKNKRILEILESLGEYKKINSNFIFYVVGDIAPDLNVEEIIHKYDLIDNVKITGFVTMDVFKDYMKITDICFNLRYPTQGESSATLNRLLGYGKIVFVNNVGSFSDLPEDVVIKIEQGKDEKKNIVDYLKLLNNKITREKYKENIMKYATEYLSIEDCSFKYISFIKQILIEEQCNSKLFLNKLYDEISSQINKFSLNSECENKIIRQSLKEIERIW
ncbi:hypothetical protein CD30_13790 [Ureibacillus massiliensis 4400831 = CIP 108448 = CCUG 49529]|uniref:Glycosyl transferase family 1 domain-containing protein n=1 Tax=Ureibacillus massiliensis 4400831 = CIP 108448 = CCUG 49529 TaxID=1211035 RepID=A0A0A3J4D4_9BACL|nr:glycosyltransferase [Ureibacillus massiliensis]KGR90043.1 hypothetical protein CD30_13790 [Ureibacillus massiliensis 4400831 = CIP 108448 = CCUG 49529]